METEQTDSPICPYCGHAEHDVLEIDFGPGLDGDTETSCNRCGRDYFANRSVTVYYTTRPMPPNA